MGISVSVYLYCDLRFYGTQYDTSGLSFILRTQFDCLNDLSSFLSSVLISSERHLGKTVTRLEYHAYTPLAIKTLHKILLRARAPNSNSSSDPDPAHLTNTIRSISIIHRLGIVPTGQTSILIAVSAPHRREAFEVCEWILEAVKKDVQIWKREWYATVPEGSSLSEVAAAAAAETTLGEAPYVVKDGGVGELGMTTKFSEVEESAWKSNS